MLKRIIAVLSALLILFSFLGIMAYADTAGFSEVSALPLRAGGGGGGSGGSGGGGGGGGHHSASGGNSSPIGKIIHFILFTLVAFSSTIAFYIKLSARSRKAKKLMKQMEKSDNAWKYKDISATVEDCYYIVQNAWADMDMTPAKEYMSDDLFERFQTKLNWMAYRKQKNIMENISLIHALPVAVHDDPDNSRDFIWFHIKGRMTDYMIDTDSGLITDGKAAPSSFTEYWQFTRKNDGWVLSKILQKNEADQIPFAD